MTTPAGTVNYGYNGLGQLATVTLGSATTTFTYDPVGFLTQKNLPNGVTMTYTPNVRDQLTNVTSRNSSNTVLQSFAYTLDNAGNRTRVTELGNSYITWGYDNLYRLKAEKRFNSSNVITWQAAFTYDGAGNRNSMTVNTSTTNYTFNALDQLTNAGAVTYNYNGRGDMTKITNGSNITNYTYDAADQLTNVTATGVNATYVYNADGNRVKQTLGSTVTNYLWDEASVYGDVVYEYNGTGGALASYVLGGTGLISQTRGTTTNYFLQDGQGSTRGLTSTGGTVTDTYSYTAFGDLYVSSGTTVNPYRYTGQQFDSLTGLYSLRARYYNPTMGRFLSQDTYPVNVNNPIELNHYVYAANSPINLNDPTGNAALAEYSILLGELTGAAFGAVQTYVCGGNLAENIAMGVLLGFDFAAGLMLYPLATNAVGLGLSAIGAGTSAYDILKNGGNACNRFNFAMSLLGVAFSGRGLVKELNARAPSLILTGAGMPTEGLSPEKPIGSGTSTNTGGTKEVLLGLWDSKSTFKRTWIELLVRGRNVFSAGEWQQQKLSTVYPLVENFTQAFSEAMTNANRINFDITRLNTVRAMRDGSVFSGNNWVSYEYYQIKTNPTWLAKTTFYTWENGILRGFSENEIELLYPILPEE